VGEAVQNHEDLRCSNWHSAGEELTVDFLVRCSEHVPILRIMIIAMTPVVIRGSSNNKTIIIEVTSRISGPLSGRVCLALAHRSGAQTGRYKGSAVVPGRESWLRHIPRGSWGSWEWRRRESWPGTVTPSPSRPVVKGQSSSPGTVISLPVVPCPRGTRTVYSACLAFIACNTNEALSRLSGLDSDLWILTKLPSTVRYQYQHQHQVPVPVPSTSPALQKQPPCINCHLLEFQTHTTDYFRSLPIVRPACATPRLGILTTASAGNCKEW
jgi:hypothetical protein